MMNLMSLIPFFFILTTFAAGDQNNESDVAEAILSASFIEEIDAFNGPFCPAESQKIKCEPVQIYRTFDGTCNNEDNPWWGASATPYTRILKSDYDDDIGYVKTKGVNHHELPGARESALILPFRPRFSGFNGLFTFMGQFLIHDSLMTKTEDTFCPCGTNNPKCHNIAIPTDDRSLKDQGECLPFPRASDASDFFECDFQRREQFSKNTHYLDMSQVYGQSKEAAAKLRIHEFGLLKYSFIPGTVLEMLPIKKISECFHEEELETKSTGCFFAGDSRVDHNSLLTGLHAIFNREHNHIARKLSIINPHWHDETVFQETRRILIACYQNIIYSEWLPNIIGEKLMEEYKLYPKETGYSFEYKKTVNPNYFSEAVAVGIRLHTLVHNRIQQCEGNLTNIVSREPLSDYMFNQGETFTNMDRLHCGLLTQATYPLNFQMAPSLSEVLNLDFPSKGSKSSLTAINVKRGRDMGLASYSNYRKLFGLKTSLNWEDAFEEFDESTMTSLKSVYKSVEDIDLFIGCAGEKSVEGGLVGNTQANIVAMQFYKLKFGDSFYFENGHNKQTRFTEEQLNQIRHYKISSLLCNSMKNEAVPRYGFLIDNLTDENPRSQKLKFSNPLVHCSNVFQIDFKLWKDTNYNNQ